MMKYPVAEKPTGSERTGRKAQGAWKRLMGCRRMGVIRKTRQQEAWFFIASWEMEDRHG